MNKTPIRYCASLDVGEAGRTTIEVDIYYYRDEDSMDLESVYVYCIYAGDSVISREWMEQRGYIREVENKISEYCESEMQSGSGLNHAMWTYDDEDNIF